MKLESIALHYGYEADPGSRSAAVPIHQTSSYTFADSQHGADLFDLKVPGNIYTRLMNPTTDVLEKRVAAMEGGVAALAVASGMAAITYAIHGLCRSGDSVVSTRQIYGGTHNLFGYIFPERGIEVRMVDHDDYAAIEEAIDDTTRALFCESIGNPSGVVADLERLAEIAHRHGIPLLVDNTVASPVLCRPIEFGADIVIHSLTKYIGGHGTSLGGIIVDAGTFPWLEYAEKYPLLVDPDPSYHGISFARDVGAAAYIARCRTTLLRDTGAAISPMNAFQILQGLETLSLRMERHCENAMKVATFLQEDSRVAWVRYAALAESPEGERCQKILKGKASGILSFGVTGGAEQAMAFIDRLQMILRLVNIGDAKSLACHPASTTHRQLSRGEREVAGVADELVRLSVGIENIDDIIEDISQAL